QNLFYLPDDGKVLTLPMADYSYQIIVDKNNGAYQGPSMIAYLAGKKDFAATTELGTFEKEYLSASKDGNYEALKKILSMLGIRYIFYNSNPFVYEKGFPG